VIARFPGAVLDRTFYAQVEGGPTDEVGHSWPAAAFARYRLIAGRPPGADDQIVVGGGSPSLVGRQVTVFTAGETKTYDVSGVTAGVPFEHAVFFAGSEAARLSPGADALVPRGGAKPDIAGVQVLRGAARHAADPSAAQDAADLSSLESFLVIAAMVAAFVALYVTGATFSLSVRQRRRELALLRFAGATPAQVSRLVWTEAALLGMAGSSAGCGLGLLGAPVLAGWLASHGLAPAWFTAPLSGGSLAALGVAFLAGLVVSVGSVTVAAHRAALVRPAEALREAMVDPGGMTWPRSLLGFGLLGTGAVSLAGLVVAFPAAASDPKTEVTLAVVMIAGATIVSPALIGPLTRLFTWPFGHGAAPAAMLVRENTLSGLRRASATMAPVLICVGLAASIWGAADTANAATGHELRLQAAHTSFVVIPSGTPGLNQTVIDRVRSIPGTGTTSVAQTTLYAFTPPLTVFHLDAPTALPFPAEVINGTGAINLRVKAGALSRLSKRTIAVDSSWHEHVGATMKLWLADGTPVSLRIVAVFADGLGANSLVVSSQNAALSLPDRLYVRIRSGANPAATEAALMAATRGDGARAVPTQKWTAAVSNLQEQQTRLGLVVLLGIAVAYGGLGIANAFLMSAAGRRRELVIVRLAGATRGQAMLITAAEALLLAGIGIFIAAGSAALILGGLSAAFSSLIGSSPPVVPWAIVAAIAGGGTLTAVAAATLSTVPALHGPLTGIPE
jgi:putative ABC transport system permease protein